MIFGLVLLHAAWQSSRGRPHDEKSKKPDPLAQRLKLNGSYPSPEGPCEYQVDHVKTGFSLMFGAGTLSGLLGIGSGALKVIAMDQAMHVPFKVSTTTSNFMIGVTAAASAGIYLSRGYIEPGLAMPVMLGVLAGSIVGARQLMGARVRVLRWIFAGVVGVMAVEMIVTGVKGEVCERSTPGSDHQRAAQNRRIVAAAVVLLGGICFLSRHGHEQPEYHVFHGTPADLPQRFGRDPCRRAIQLPGRHPAWSAVVDPDAGGARGVLAGGLRAGARPNLYGAHVHRARDSDLSLARASH